MMKETVPPTKESQVALSVFHSAVFACMRERSVASVGASSMMRGCAPAVGCVAMVTPADALLVVSWTLVAVTVNGPVVVPAV